MESKAESSTQDKSSSESDSPEGSAEDTPRQLVLKAHAGSASFGGRNSIDEPWEASLTGEEFHLLEELGLGVAVNITAKQPWAGKSAFQAKPVPTPTQATNDLIVINESNRFRRTSEQVDTYSEVQAGLESSFRPDPSKPISVNIAADFHRSNTRSKTIKGTTVLTRTVAFRVKPPTSEHKEEFEVNLHRWLVDTGCVKFKCPTCKDTNAEGEGEQHQCSQSIYVYDRTTNHRCIDYLKALGGVTHYISSVTLGATRYQVTLNSTIFTSASTSSGVGVDSFVTVSTKSKATRKIFQSTSKTQQIGKIPQQEGKNLKELLQFRTKGEAVVRCTYNSLANLVSHPELRRQLDLGIQEYVDMQKNGTRGPYHIATAETHDTNIRLRDGTTSRKRLYWAVRQKEIKLNGRSIVSYQIECTFNRDEEASNFYLKPITSENYFHIVTDPEDKRGRLLNIDKGLEREPQRFIRIHPQSKQLEAAVVIDKHIEHSFKLKNPQTGETCPIARSQWLPEASLGSQPYVICREGFSFHASILHRRNLSSILIRQQELEGGTSKYTVIFGSRYSLTQSPFRDRLFILEPGHKS